jgi:carbon storage regulator
MLVLSRKEQESIVLPDLGVTIRVSEISGNRVRLAVEAPREVQILRLEVLERSESTPRPAPSAAVKAQSRSGEHRLLVK